MKRFRGLAYLLIIVLVLGIGANLYAGVRELQREEAIEDAERIERIERDEQRDAEVDAALAEANRRLAELGRKPVPTPRAGDPVFIPVEGEPGKRGPRGPEGPLRPLSEAIELARQALAEFCTANDCVPEDGRDGIDGREIVDIDCDGTTEVYTFNRGEAIRVEDGCPPPPDDPEEPDPEPSPTPPAP